MPDPFPKKKSGPRKRKPRRRKKSAATAAAGGDSGAAQEHRSPSPVNAPPLPPATAEEDARSAAAASSGKKKLRKQKPKNHSNKKRSEAMVQSLLQDDDDETRSGEIEDFRATSPASEDTSATTAGSDGAVVLHAKRSKKISDPRKRTRKKRGKRGDGGGGRSPSPATVVAPSATADEASSSATASTSSASATALLVPVVQKKKKSRMRKQKKKKSRKRGDREDEAGNIEKELDELDELLLPAEQRRLARQDFLIGVQTSSPAEQRRASRRIASLSSIDIAVPLPGMLEMLARASISGDATVTTVSSTSAGVIGAAPLVALSDAWSRGGVTSPGAVGATQQFWPVWAEQTETWERARLKQWVVWAEEEERLRRVIEMPTARRERFLTPQTSGGHHALVCPYRLVGCDALCQREELVDHLSTCRYRQRQIVETQLLLCPHSFAGCPHRVRLCDLASHLSSCDFALALSPRPNKDRDASFTEDYEVVCPYASFGCTHTCMRANLQVHLTRCTFTKEKRDEEQVCDYEVVCPYASFGCMHTCSLVQLGAHLEECPSRGDTRAEEQAERDRTKQSVIEEEEKERKRRVGEIEADLKDRPTPASREGRMLAFQRQLHDEAERFVGHCRETSSNRKVLEQQVTHDIGEIAKTLCEAAAGDSRCYCRQYGSVATGTAIPSSDLDLVVFGDSIKLDSFAHALAAQSWAIDVKPIFRARVPVVKLLYVGGLDVDITFTKFTQHGSEAESEVPASHPSTTFVRCLLQRYVALLPLVLMLKQLLAQRGLNDPYTGGLTSYGLLLLVTSVLQQRERGVNAKAHLGALLMDFLQIFGNEFTPNATVVVLHADVLQRQVVGSIADAVSTPGSPQESTRRTLGGGTPPPLELPPAQLCAGIDPLTIVDPLDKFNNVGRSCFNIAAVQRCFADALAALVFHSQLPPEEVVADDVTRDSIVEAGDGKGAGEGEGEAGGAEGASGTSPNAGPSNTAGGGGVLDADGCGLLMLVMRGAKRHSGGRGAAMAAVGTALAPTAAAAAGATSAGAAATASVVRI